MSSVRRPSAAISTLLTLGILMFALAFSPVPVRAASGPYTTWTSVITYSTSSGYTPNNVNITWTNTDDCGTLNTFGPGATWAYSAGSSPCASSLPSGTITETISADGQTLASCTDSNGAATWGSQTVSSGSAPGCTSAGLGVTIVDFYAQAYDASGNPISASSANYDWVIAVVIVIVILILIYFYMRRRSASPAGAPQPVPPAAPSAPAG